jgi:hypothetical protein
VTAWVRVEPHGRCATVAFARYSPTHSFDLWLLDTRTRRWQHLPSMPLHLVPKVTDVQWHLGGEFVIW